MCPGKMYLKGNTNHEEHQLAQKIQTSKLFCMILWMDFFCRKQPIIKVLS